MVTPTRDPYRCNGPIVRPTPEHPGCTNTAEWRGGRCRTHRGLPAWDQVYSSAAVRRAGTASTVSPATLVDDVPPLEASSVLADNPYLAYLVEHPDLLQCGMLAGERFELQRRFSFAVPTEEALAAVAACGPLIEIGAGKGYWAHLLRERGVDIVCYDIGPGEDNRYTDREPPYTAVEPGGPEKVAEHPGRTLFLCWPPYETPMASQSLAKHRGDRLVYIGELNGCTGDEAFLTALRSKWEIEQRIELPNYDGFHDELIVYRRRAPVRRSR